MQNIGFRSTGGCRKENFDILSKRVVAFLPFAFAPPLLFFILVQFFGPGNLLGLISAENVLGNWRLMVLEGRKCRWVVEDFHHHFRLNVPFFCLLSWHGVKDFLLLRKLDDKVISPWALKLITLQAVYKGVDPRGQIRDELGDGKDLFPVG